MRSEAAAGSRSAGRRAASTRDDGIAVHRPGGRDQGATLRVELAHDQGLPGHAVEGLFDLGLDEGGLVLDHHYLVEPSGHPAELGRVERPGKGDPDEAQPEVGAGIGVEAQLVERPHGDGVGVTAGHNAQSGPG